MGTGPSTRKSGASLARPPFLPAHLRTLIHAALRTPESASRHLYCRSSHAK
jgi:hypothetical protein